MAFGRSELQQEVVDALVDAKAVNFEAVSAVLAKHGPRMAKAGIDFGVIINWRVYDVCIPPDPFRLASNIDELRGAAREAELTRG